MSPKLSAKSEQHSATYGSRRLTATGSLQVKLVLALGLMFLIFLAINESIQRRVVAPELAVMDSAVAIEKATQVVAGINREADHLADLAQLWSSIIIAHPDAVCDPSIGESHPRSGLLTPQDSKLFVLSFRFSDADGSAPQFHWLSASSEVERERMEELVAELFTDSKLDTSGCQGGVRLDDQHCVLLATRPLTTESAANQDSQGHHPFWWWGVPWIKRLSAKFNIAPECPSICFLPKTIQSPSISSCNHSTRSTSTSKHSCWAWTNSL